MVSVGFVLRNTRRCGGDPDTQPSRRDIVGVAWAWAEAVAAVVWVRAGIVTASARATVARMRASATRT